MFDSVTSTCSQKSFSKQHLTLTRPLKRWVSHLQISKRWPWHEMNSPHFLPQQALAEERTVYNRSVNKLKYLSVAVNALKRLKNQNAVTAKGETIHNLHFHKINYVDQFCTTNSYWSGAGEDKCNNQRLRGSIPLNSKKCKGTGEPHLCGHSPKVTSPLTV